MNKHNPSTPYSGQPANSRPAGFPDRLATIIGSSSVRAFARKAGISDTFLRQCLSGRTEPTRMKLIAIAEAGGVSVEWLATGREPAGQLGIAEAPAAPPLDQALLETVIECIEESLAQSGRSLTPARMARLVTAVYEMYELQGRSSVSREKIRKLVSSAV